MTPTFHGPRYMREPEVLCRQSSRAWVCGHRSVFNRDAAVECADSVGATPLDHGDASRATGDKVDTNFLLDVVECNRSILYRFEICALSS
jgi:hypothetical protein